MTLREQQDARISAQNDRFWKRNKWLKEFLWHICTIILVIIGACVLFISADGLFEWGIIYKNIFPDKKDIPIAAEKPIVIPDTTNSFQLEQFAKPFKKRINYLMTDSVDLSDKNKTLESQMRQKVQLLTKTKHQVDSLTKIIAATKNHYNKSVIGNLVAKADSFQKTILILVSQRDTLVKTVKELLGEVKLLKDSYAKVQNEKTYYELRCDTLAKQVVFLQKTFPMATKFKQVDTVTVKKPPVIVSASVGSRPQKKHALFRKRYYYDPPM